MRMGVLLAAGHGRRWGEGEKLAARHRGRPVLAWSAEAMRGATLDARVAIVRNPALHDLLTGFRCLPPQPGGDMSASLRAAAEHALAAGATRLLIALGDMPQITAAHLDSLVSACTDDSAAATAHAGRPGVPACLPADWIAPLLELQGDAGAGGLLARRGARLVELPAAALRDIDRRCDVEG